MSDSPIAAALIDWHARHGRHDLPWQTDRTAYRVWVSEIMLQQTQVSTVIPYYERFMRRFADVCALADAPLDEVLHLWSGLGYYARARNLHRAAVRIRDELGGVFPQDFGSVASLPGIGRSTAGAILALSRGERFAILDGNVKRVLARYFGIEGASADHLPLLWERAEECTPASAVEVYTQAIMDLGATLCTRRNPCCTQCPLSDSCSARRTGRQHEIPAARAVRARRLEHTFMLIALRADGGVLLTRRPPTGVWGGLYCLPQFASDADARAYAVHAFGKPGGELRSLQDIEHGFTHFDLTITPLLARCSGSFGVMDADDVLWYNPREPAAVGMPAPVKTLLDTLGDPER